MARKYNVNDPYREIGMQPIAPEDALDFENTAENPRTPPDPRFDPADVGDGDPEVSGFGQDGEDGEYDAIEVQARVQRLIRTAVDYYEEQLEPDQVSATNYYWRRPFGDEEQGRSKVVSGDVADATNAQMPSLLRIFCGPTHPVEFRPEGPEDVPVARQMTDFVRHVAMRDNPGFLILQNAMKDALVRRIGIFKWYWDEVVRVERAVHEGLDEEQVALLQSEQDAEVEITSEPDEQTGTYPEVIVTRRNGRGRARFIAVPPEEFVVTPGARDIDSAPCVVHVRDAPAEELIALGIDPDLIEDNKGRAHNVNDGLREARQYNQDAGTLLLDRDQDYDESQELVVFAEAYILMDLDGDGIAERRLFQCVGPDYEVANGDGLGEIVDEVPFAILTPDPEPHALIGPGNWDLLRDVQLVKSHVQRGMLNSLSKAIDPDTEVVANEVNMGDMLSKEVSKIIRVRRPQMIREIPHAFLGADLLSVLGYWDEIKENRTGTSKAAAGLDADSLQSATKAAVAATITGAQNRLEYIARVFAETGIKRLYRGLLRLLIRHQDQPRMVRLRNQWVQVDPRHWDAEMDMEINVGLGQGPTEERIAVLSGIVQKQEAMLQQGVPLVSLVEYRKTLALAAELVGYHGDEFFKPWTEEDEQRQQEQAAQQPPPPDAAMALVEVERMKAQVLAAEAQAKLALEREKMMLQDDRERDKAARDTVLKELEIEAKYRVEIEDSKLRADVARDRAAMDADIKRQQVAAQPAPTE